MIVGLDIHNFKAWQTTGPMRLAPITALFGSNSTGKTSLLQLLLMLKQTTDSPDRAQALNLGDERSLVELGTFPELLYDHDLTRTLAWQMTWRLPRPLKIDDPTHPGAVLFQDDTLGFSAEVAWQGNGDQTTGRAVLQHMAYSFAGHEFRMHLKAEGKQEYELSSHPPGFEFLRARGRPWGLPAPIKCYGFPSEARAYYQNSGFLSDFELEFERLFGRIFYLGPLREYPQRQYTWAGARPIDVGRRGERVVDALLAAREIGETIAGGHGKKRLTVEERVALWLRDLGLIERFEIRSIAPGSKLFQVWIQRSSNGPEVLITDVGFGVSQILPVIALCYYVPEGSTVLLEQPEIHLHPRVQGELADVFIDAIKTRRIQIILESHSEHLLRRLQRRIAEERLHAEQTALYFCAMNKGQSQLEPLDLDPYGSIANWPRDFFGDEFGEIAAMSRAAIKRKQRETR